MCFEETRLTLTRSTDFGFVDSNSERVREPALSSVIATSGDSLIPTSAPGMSDKRDLPSPVSPKFCENHASQKSIPGTEASVAQTSLRRGTFRLSLSMLCTAEQLKDVMNKLADVGISVNMTIDPQ